MFSPRHLWSGNWREESERAQAERARLEAPVVEDDGPPAEPPERPEPPAPSSGGSRHLRIGAVVAAAVVLAVGAYAVGANTDENDAEKAARALPAVASQPLTARKGQTRAAAIYALASPAVVSIRTGSGSGTGFLVDDTRTVVTNAHVVGTATSVTVRFGPDGRNIQADVLGTDPSSDLAVVRLPSGSAPAGAKPLELAESNDVRVGDAVIAIGNPFGLDRTATAGIVSALGRRIGSPNGFSIDDAIQTDAPINPGNSGGPLLDDGGHVIGVNSQIETGGSSGNVGIGFAVPSDTVRQVVPQLELGKRIARAWLGVESGASASGAGAAVQSVVAGGPADKAGIQAGDVVVAIDGVAVTDFEAVVTAVDHKQPGDKVDVRVSRGGREQTIGVTLGTRPAQAP